MWDTIIHAYILSLPRIYEDDINKATKYDAYQLRTEVEVAIHGARKMGLGFAIKIKVVIFLLCSFFEIELNLKNGYKLMLFRCLPVFSVVRNIYPTKC
jgi:hypothetical protein